MAARKWTRAEVELRSRREDATIIINNVVYNVSEFLEDHPGGPEVLLDNAGRDASQCFHDVGHSDIATEWMKKFVIGEIVDEDKREEVRRDTSSFSETEESTHGGFVSVWATPLAVALFAALLYSYLFQ